MTSGIQELRDLNLELTSLKARKDAIKKQLEEHRDSFTDEQIASSTKEATEIRDKISQLKEKIKLAEEKAEQENRNRGEIKIMENENKKLTLELLSQNMYCLKAQKVKEKTLHLQMLNTEHWE